MHSRNGSNVEERFWQSVDKHHLHQIYEAIKAGYYQTQAIFDPLDLDPSLERQSRGHLRSNLIADKLLSLNSTERGISVTLKPNASGSYIFAEILINSKVLLTVKSNDDPEALPSESDFRKEHAKFNPPAMPLLDLLPNFYAEDSTKELINGIIMHKGGMSEPKFVSLIFPCNQYLQPLSKPIDVIAICNELVSSKEFIKSQRNLKRRPAPIEVEKKSLKLKKQGGE